MEHPKFKFEQKVSLVGKLATEYDGSTAHVRTVYSPSQKKKLDADYCIILSNGDEVDVKESDLKAA